MTAEVAPQVGHARRLVQVAVPALVIGVASAFLLVGLYAVAGLLQTLLWQIIPAAVGVRADSPGWTIAILTLTGVLVGLVVWLAPGHAGPDPATQSMVSPALSPRVLPSLLIALLLVLASGVSLGPENPILAVAVSLSIAVGGRLVPSIQPRLWAGLAVAGMVGAMFGTPVAAALVLSGTLTESKDRPLWDQMFGPLMAAAASSVTIQLLQQSTFGIPVAPYDGPHLLDLLTGSLVALAAALLGLVAVYLFPLTHRLIHRIRHPLPMLVCGGLVLGLLGALGGQITLFRGLDQLAELADTSTRYTVAGLALIVIVKLAALVVAGASGFPGGRIFPAVFIGGALGILAHAAFPSLPQALCVAAGVLGLVFAVSREGWISLFIAVSIVGDVKLIPILLIATLPVWLLLSGRREMLITDSD